MSPMDGRDELRGRFTRWIVITAEHAQKNYLRAEKKQLQTVPLEEADVAIVDTALLSAGVMPDSFDFEEQRLAEAFRELPLVGDDASGILLSIDMDNREIYVSTTGYAMKVLTDARVEKVLDAAYDSVADGNYAEGALGAIDSIENYLEMGVPAGQYTQVREEKKHSLEWYEALFAAVAAAIVAALPCFSVMRQYKMQKEHRQSLGFHMAYRADSALHFVQNEEQFVNRSVVTRRIPKNPGPGASGGSAGRTTIHQGSSGRMHGGGGRKF